MRPVVVGLRSQQVFCLKHFNFIKLQFLSSFLLTFLIIANFELNKNIIKIHLILENSNFY